MTYAPESYAPDYGLAMLEMGMEEDATISFSPFHLSHLSALDGGDFTTSVKAPIGEVEHALSVDLSPAMLAKMLAFAPQETVQAVLNWLQGAAVGDTLELPAPVVCDVSLAFGEPQGNDEETYVPLVVEDVLPAYGLLDRSPDEQRSDEQRSERH